MEIILPRKHMTTSTLQKCLFKDICWTECIMEYVNPGCSCEWSRL